MTDEARNPDADEREPYEPPTVTDLGSLAELTQGVPGVNQSDTLDLGSV